MKKAIFWLIVLSCLGVAGSYGYAYYQEQQQEKSRVEKARRNRLIAIVKRRNIEYRISSSGDLAPALQVDVKPEVSARIMKIGVEVGATIKKGDHLCTLEDKDLQTQKDTLMTNIRGAEVTMEQSQRQYSRAQRLYERKLISLETYQNAETELESSRNNYDKAQKQLESQVNVALTKTVITAPMDGTVLSIPVVEGQVAVAAASVNSGTLLMTIADLTKMFINTHVNQVDIANIVVKQKVDITVDAIPGAIMKGTVTLVSPVATIKNSVKGFSVLVSIDKLDPRVKPGMTADLSFPVIDLRGVLAVPLAAIFVEDGKKYVYVTERHPMPSSKPERREVDVGISNYDFSEIKSGLKEDDAVLLEKPRNTDA
ncbi:MAG: efflux RND transporter periplasmic adaptor subunit [Candidatus Methylacidiphilales bacterium]|nr:efflux RND transporter periplasmic adaptor subunit [Candidatus Methylacidiphilales bacterium]